MKNTIEMWGLRVVYVLSIEWGLRVVHRLNVCCVVSESCAQIECVLCGE